MKTHIRALLANKHLISPYIKEDTQYKVVKLFKEGHNINEIASKLRLKKFSIFNHLVFSKTLTEEQAKELRKQDIKTRKSKCIYLVMTKEDKVKILISSKTKKHIEMSFKKVMHLGGANAIVEEGFITEKTFEQEKKK